MTSGKIDPDNILARLRVPPAPASLAERIIDRTRRLPVSARRRLLEEMRLLWLLPHPALCGFVLFAIGVVFGMGAESPATMEADILAAYDVFLEEDWL